MDEAGEGVKTKLFCIVVGDDEPFPVDINLKTKTVGELKEVVKAKNPVTVACEAKDLKLFLAKTGRDGDWLNTAGVAAVKLDKHGKFPQDFERMDPILLLDNAKYFGKGFHPVERHVHVLVVLPIDRAAKRQKIEIDLSYRKDIAAILQLATALERPTSLEPGKLFALPDTVLGTAFSNGLYIRHEYWTLYGIIQNALASLKSTRRVLVLGSPGIGKSVFGVFLLLLFLTKKKDVAYCPLGQSCTYYFSWDATGGGYTVSDTPRTGKLYAGLFDGNEKGALDYNNLLHAFVFASPRTTNYNEFVKEGCFQVIMNPWTKEECRSFVDVIHAKDRAQESKDECPSSVAMVDEEGERKEERLSSVVEEDDDEWFQKFNLVGGKPRFLFSADTCDNLLGRVKSAIPATLKELEEQITRYHNEVFDERMKHILFLFRRDEQSPSRSYLTYSSLAVERMVGARYTIQSAGKIRSLLKTPQPDLQSWRGKEMENSPASFA